MAWAAPASIIAGTALGAGQLDASASFNGAPLAGVLTYSPAAGSILPVGSAQILTVTFTPAESTDYRPVTSSVTIDVLPQTTTSTPPVTIVGEVPVFRRKLNRRGKPVGRPVLTGFTMQFSASIGASSAMTTSNYVLDTVTSKRTKRGVSRILHPVNGFSVTYEPASDSATIDVVRPNAFRTGGQLTVLPGVDGGGLVGTTVFSIARGGRSLGPSRA
ncbi:MAG: hypothetical protein HIU89_13745 [Proteobacteria bacterium]|nr:hypothetical protein [Pseudomonadota bacterium]